MLAFGTAICGQSSNRPDLKENRILVVRADPPCMARSLHMRALLTIAVDVDAALDDQWTLRIIGRLGSDVLDSPLPFAAEEVEPETVTFRVGLCN
jgi:hypothetical protein